MAMLHEDFYLNDICGKNFTPQLEEFHGMFRIYENILQSNDKAPIACPLQDGGYVVV